MINRERLSKENLRKLKGMCKEGNYDAIVALLKYHIEEGIEIALKTTGDHRFIQGKVQALSDFYDDIVRQPE